MKAKDVVGILIVIAVLAVGGGGFYAAHKLKAARIDAVTLCPKAAPVSQTIILIDRTDPLTKTEQARVRAIVEREREALAVGAKIAVAVLRQPERSTTTTVETVAALCNPRASADPLTGNPSRVRARYEASFVSPLERAMESAAGEGSAPTSPIAAAISAVVDQQVKDHEGTPGKLILISDLLEHTERGSAYRGTLTSEVLAAETTASFQTWLQKKRVEIELIPRPEHQKAQSLARQIWTEYFRARTGEPPAITMISPATVQATPARNRS